MTGIRTEFLFRIVFEVPEIADLGKAPTGTRRVARVAGGHFEGPRLKGTVIPNPGGDWLTFTDDGVTRLDVRAMLRTDDGAMILMTYHGVRHGPPEVMARIAAGEAVAPEELYFRIAPRFETGSKDYAWLNRVIAVGTGERLPTGPIYNVHQVL